MTHIVVIIILICIIGALGLMLAFFIIDNGYLKVASKNQSATFISLRKTIEDQDKIIEKLEDEISLKTPQDQL